MKVKIIRFLLLFFISIQVYAQTQYGGIHGRITDLSTGEPLVTAQIIALNTSYGTISDEGGFYHLALPAGRYQIKVQMVGYQSDTLEVEVVFGKSREYNFSLKLKPYEGEKVVVIGSIQILSRT